MMITIEREIEHCFQTFNKRTTLSTWHNSTLLMQSLPCVVSMSIKKQLVQAITPVKKTSL